MYTYIITPTWNSGPDIGPLAASLIRETRRRDWDWVIVENGSDSDDYQVVADTVAFVRGYHGQFCGGVHFLVNEENQGIPVAQNQGLDYLEDIAKPPYAVLLLDADTVVERNWLDRFEAYAGVHPDVGILGGARSPGGKPHPVYHNNGGRWYVYDGLDGHGVEGESIDFAGAYLRAELMERQPRMDPEYRLYDGYDQDFSFRVRSWGWRIVAIDGGIIHRPSAAMKRKDYQWSGGGRPEWNNLRAANLKRFSDIWGDFLADPRQDPAKELAHLERMNAKLVADAGDRKEIPQYERSNGYDLR